MEQRSERLSWQLRREKADVLQRYRYKEVKGWTGSWKPWGERKPMCWWDNGTKERKVEGEGRCQLGALLKLLVKNKPLPVTAKGWQTRPLRRSKWGYSEWGTDWQLKSLKKEKDDYTRWALNRVKGWKLKPLQQTSTNQHERLAVETLEERELRLECYSTRYKEQQFCAATAPTVSTVFHSSQVAELDNHAFIQVRSCNRAIVAPMV